MSTAADLRDEGQDAAIAADMAVQKGYGDYIRAAIAWYAEHRSQPWTCDHIRGAAADLAHADDVVTFDPSPNLLPALIGVAVGKGEIVRQPRDARSGRRSRRASRVGTYLGVKYVTPAPSVGATPAAAEVEGAGRGGAAIPCQPSPSGRSST